MRSRVVPMKQRYALGIDIGGSGIKGAIVDLEKGEFATDRLRIPTPQPATPEAVAAVVKQIADHFAAELGDGPIGITVPAVVTHGRTRSAANIDPAWVDAPAEDIFREALGRPITLVNDADAAGIAEVPTTFGEMMAACDAAQAAGVLTADVKCFGVSLNGWFVEQWVAQQGEPLVNNDNGRAGRATEVLLTSDAVKNVVEFFKAMNDKGYYTYTGRLEDWSGSDAIFTNGNVMFHITSTADLVNITNAIDGKFELVTGMLPIVDGTERNGVVIGGASVWLVGGHPQEELEVARDFVLYMTNPENMVSWHKATGYYPVRNSSVDMLEAEGWFEEFPNASTAFEQLLNTRTNSATAGAMMGTFQATRTIVEEAIQKVLGGADVDAALEVAKRLADAQLAEYNANF